MTQLRKTVDLTDHDEERQIATGALLVPDRIDSQGDYFEPATIERIAHDYMRRLQAGEATLKLMHAVDAAEKLSLVENRVLDEPETIGETEHAAGTWIVSVKVADPDVWQLLKDGVLGGFSIGGDNVDGETLPPEEVPDEIERSDEWPADAPVQRIDDVRINEFSAVDRPAVAPAQVEVLKADLEKEHTDALEAGGEACIEALEERGHDRADAERLCRAMHKADGKQELPPEVADCKDSVLADNPGMSESEAIAICRDQLNMSDDPDTDDPEEPTAKDIDDATLGKRLKRLLFPSADGTDDAVSPESGPAEDREALDKAGQTLSAANVAEAKAVHDAAATMLERQGHDDHKGGRTYTADRTDDFEMADHHAKMATLSKQAIPEAESAQLLYPDEETAEAVAEEMGLGETHEHDLDGETFYMPGADHAAFEAAVAELAASHDDEETASTDTETTGAESPADDDTTEHMSDEPTDDTEKATDEPPAWAEALTEKVETIEARVDEIDDETEKMADAPEWAQDLAEKVEGLDDRVDKIAKAEADTDQVAGAEKGAETTDEASAFKAALGGAN